MGRRGRGRRLSNAGHLEPRPEKNLGWNEGRRAAVLGWAASGPDPSGGAGDGGKLPDVASPADRTALYSLHLWLASSPTRAVTFSSFRK